MKIIHGFKTEMKPNDRQRTLFLQHAGCARFAYNWGLERCIEARKNGEKKPSAMELHRQLNAIKEPEFPWMYESSKCAPQEALRDLDRAYKNFFRRCKQGKRGKKGFPRFKSRSRGNADNGGPPAACHGASLLRWSSALARRSMMALRSGFCNFCTKCSGASFGASAVITGT